MVSLRSCFFVMFGLIVFSTSIHAQDQMQDVVYLKNGSVIRGIIIEQVPGKSLKIQTRDGNVFVYKIEEVERMTKEAAPGPEQTVGKPAEGFGVHGSAGLDVIEGGFGFGGGFSYAWGVAEKGTAVEFGLVAFYAPDVDLFIGGVVANWLFSYSFKKPGVYFVVGSGAAFGTIEDLGSAAAVVTNLGVGGTFGGGFEMRLETPVLFFIGDGVAIAPTVTLSLGARF